MNEKYVIQAIYNVRNTHEFAVDINDFSFLVVYGHHINGWFIAIPNWNFCTEAAEPTDTFYNTEKLSMSKIDGIQYAAHALALAIDEHYNAVKGE